jgi:hypothetical protein
VLSRYVIILIEIINSPLLQLLLPSFLFTAYSVFISNSSPLFSYGVLWCCGVVFHKIFISNSSPLFSYGVLWCCGVVVLSAVERGAPVVLASLHEQPQVLFFCLLYSSVCLKTFYFCNLAITNYVVATIVLIEQLILAADAINIYVDARFSKMPSSWSYHLRTRVAHGFRFSIVSI